MTTTHIGTHGGVPAHLRSFRQAGVNLFTFCVPGIWWLGPACYDLGAFDAYITDYVAHIPEGYFMPRINMAPQGHPWWGRMHPAEMSQLRPFARSAPGT